MSKPSRGTAAGRAYLDLQKWARRDKRGTQELLTMYVVERWLARLSRSSYTDDFVLKGGMLLAALGNRRPTVDADALARNMPSDQDSVARRVAEIAALSDPDDGVEFLLNTVSTTVIRDAALYSGVRVAMRAQIATAQVKLQLDINFGDPVIPEPSIVELPALRPGFKSIRILGYPIETVLAEKLVTAMDLALANTRVRDYVDVYTLTRTHKVTVFALHDAMTATSSFRGVRLVPLAQVTEGLGVLRASTYRAYRRGLGDVGTELPFDFNDVVRATAGFIDPVIIGMDGRSEWDPVARRWRIN